MFPIMDLFRKQIFHTSYVFMYFPRFTIRNVLCKKKFISFEIVNPISTKVHTDYKRVFSMNRATCRFIPLLIIAGKIHNSAQIFSSAKFAKSFASLCRTFTIQLLLIRHNLYLQKRPQITSTLQLVTDIKLVLFKRRKIKWKQLNFTP